MRTALAALATFVTLAASSPAQADAVPNPPDDCLAGTIPETCHGGPHCLPTLCRSDGDCASGATCRSQRVCVDTITCAGLRPHDAPPPPEFTVVRGECTEDCARCEPLSYCGAKPTSIAGLFGCHGAGGGTTLMFVVAALALLAVAHHLPRRRPYRVAIPVLALAFVIGAIGSAAAAPEQLARWSERLAALDVDPAPLAGARVAFSAHVEPGVLPDGGVQLPSAWLDTPDAPAVLARLAHLVRHLELGLPDPASAGSCAAWQVLMLGLELDGLAVESRVLHALGAPMTPAALVAEVRLRVDRYRARCAGSPE